MFYLFLDFLIDCLKSFGNLYQSCAMNLHERPATPSVPEKCLSCPVSLLPDATLSHLV
jgi:hypothetical protein